MENSNKLKEYYVYTHTNTAGEILYAGAGKGDKWFAKQFMSKKLNAKRKQK